MAIDDLEAAMPTIDPQEAYRVAHAALASAIKVIARAGVAPGKVVDWMMACQLDGDVVRPRRVGVRARRPHGGIWV